MLILGCGHNTLDPALYYGCANAWYDLCQEVYYYYINKRVYDTKSLSCECI